MEINTIHLGHLRNNGHYQFFALFRNLVYEFGAEVLKIAPMFTAWLVHFALEEERIKKVSKSTLTLKIHVADKRRSIAFRSIAMINKELSQNHYIPEVKEAAINLQVVFDTFGNIARFPLKEKTGAFDNFLQAVKSKQHIKQMETVMLADWLKELDEANNEVIRLTRLRYSEASERTDAVMTDIRAEVDAGYLAMVRRIDALMEVEGNEVCANFIRQLNIFIDDYNK